MIARNIRWERAGQALGATQVLCAHSWWHRARGLLGRPAPELGWALEIRPCPSVHTFFMAYTLDVVFLNQDNQVVKVAAGLKPWRASRAKGARWVLEFAEGGAQALGLQVGDKCVYC